MIEIDLNRKKAMLVIITGKKGIGKTVVCRRLVDIASQSIGTCGGIFTYKLPGGSMVVENILTMKQMVLAGSPRTYRGPQLENYSFNPAAIKFRLSAVESARDFPILLIDDIGLLELDDSVDGNVLPLIKKMHKKDRIVAIDEDMLSDLLPLIEKPDNIFSVTLGNRDTLPDLIVDSIRGKLPKP